MGQSPGDSFLTATQVPDASERTFQINPPDAAGAVENIESSWPEV